MSNPLVDATWEADAEKVAELIAEGANVNGPGEDGEHAIEIACSLNGGYPDIARLLLDAGAIPTDQAIAQAAYANNITCVRMLLDAGADPQAGVISGVTRDIDVLQLLLERGAVPDGRVLELAVGCNTSVHFRGGIDRVKLLLRYGAPVNDPSASPPLLSAASNRDMQSTALLISSGADPTRSNEYGHTALHWAAMRDDVEIAETLWKAGARIDAVDQLGRSPLIWAVDHPSIDVANWLISVGADLELKDQSGIAAWELAYLHRHESIAKLIAKSHSIPNWIEEELKKIAEEVRAEVSEKGSTPLHRAVLERKHNKVQALIEFGADVNATNTRGQTPLMLAAQYGQPYMIERLARHGANVSARDGQGKTAMHWTTFKHGDYQNAMRYLVSLGADLNCRDDEGRTPLIEAAIEHQYFPAKALIALGADIEAKDNSDCTALAHALARKSHNVALLLRISGAVTSGKLQ